MEKYSRKKLAAAFVTLLERHPVKPVAALMARQLLSRKMAHDLDIFMQDIARERRGRHKHLDVKLRSAHELTAALRREIGDVLRARAGADTVQVTAEIDRGVKGKFVAHTPAGDWDVSAATQLNHLKEKF